MTTDPDKLVASIIQSFLGLTAGRVVLYAQNWDPPKDDYLYITIANGNQITIGVNSFFDKETNEDVVESSVCQELIIEATSKNREAVSRKQEIYMALVSQLSEQKQDEQKCKISWKGDILDLSFIEGASALKRFRFNCVVFFISEIRKSSQYYSNFQETFQEVT